MAAGYTVQYGSDEKDIAAANAVAESFPTADGEEPNEYEKGTLRRIGENLPASAYLIAIVELTERFTYYGYESTFT